MAGHPEFTTTETWELLKLEGPTKLANSDPILGVLESNHVRYQALFLDQLTDELIEISVNYNKLTGEFGIVKLASGK